MRLYEELVARRGLFGVRAFSRQAFQRQLALPGLIALRAIRHGRTVGMTLWLEDAPNAHYHLGAFSREGYEVSASYALFVVALEHLRGRRVRWVDLGGAPGTGSEDGLMRFKHGWASGERIANLYGRMMNRNAHAALAGRGRGAVTTWFLQYRAAERNLAGASWGYDDESSTG